MTDDQPFRHSQPSAAVLSSDEARRTAIVRIAEHAGCRLLAGTSLDTLPVPPDILLVDIGSIHEEITDLLARLDLYLDRQRCQAMIWTDMEQLDAVYAALPGAHVVIGSDDGQAATILETLLPVRNGGQVREERKDADFVALHRISGELAGVAQRLADMAEHARPPAPALALVPQQPPEPPTHPVTAADIRILIRRRRLRDQYFGAEMLADPAWDILLDLFASAMEEKDVSVSSLCIAAAVPPTTALRWIGAMTEAGMLMRSFDPADGRRVFISLTPDSFTRMQQYFGALGGGAAVI